MSPTGTDAAPVGRIVGLYTGKTQERWEGRPPSAILKEPVHDPIEVDTLGFAGDEHADPSAHGGVEKAVHHYASEHMAFWRDQFPEDAARFAPGCFGENVSTTGLTEENLCLGDVLTLGTAKVQICQGRQPCWKLNAHMDNNQLAAQFQKSGKTGWYYRVIEKGMVRIGDEMTLVSRAHAEWPLTRVIRARFDARLDPDLAVELSGLPAMAGRWRDAFRKKTDRNFVEDTRARLHGT